MVTLFGLKDSFIVHVFQTTAQQLKTTLGSITVSQEEESKATLGTGSLKLDS